MKCIHSVICGKNVLFIEAETEGEEDEFLETGRIGQQVERTFKRISGNGNLYIELTAKEDKS